MPGLIGPSCKYRNFTNYLSSNINEIERIKNDQEIIKRENKENKKRIEDIFKTVLNLVDGSNSKCIEYIHIKEKEIEEKVKKKIDEFNENFKSLLMTKEDKKKYMKILLTRYKIIIIIKKKLMIC